jgi:hypothetical protein
MGKVRTSAIFYRRGIPNTNNGFANSVNGNWSIVQPTFLFNTPIRNTIIPINPVVTPELIKNGQVLLLDAGNQNSYSGSGTLWSNLGSGSSVYNTTLFNSPSFTNNGLSSYFLFNGTDQYGDMVRPVQDSFSWCILFNTTQISGDPDAAAWYSNGNPQIIGGDINGTTNDYGISIGIGTTFFGTGYSAVPIDVTIKSITNTFNDGNWHYLVATKNKTTNKMELYMDGVLNSIDYNGNDTTLDACSTIRIAAESFDGLLPPPGNYFEGKIAVVQAYNRVLSSSEINNNYNYLKSRYS